MNFVIQDVMGLEDKPDHGLHKRDIEKLIEGRIRSQYTVSYSTDVLGQFNDLLQKLNSKTYSISLYKLIYPSQIIHTVH